ncbi:hypothetical protein [Streptomyces luteolus]|uniref:Uncharacterized protein n=1 Tax=Streptomyces luteolus TaxID=3043615 RepID=A0ABT6STM3_9ACTN|nr:hypothetical protein [Streptomyces sp. B-S-A12]MDI3418002.1 hypothetical protein [Streptomyces sp. B-S-A12]
MDITDIAAIVLAARVVGIPTQRQADGATVHRLSLHGQQRGQFAHFSLREGHHRWRLESVTDDHGTNPLPRTLGRRLSARLTDLHSQATDSPTSPSPASPPPAAGPGGPAHTRRKQTVDQHTREQLLYAEAAKRDVSPLQIHEAVSLVANSLQHDLRAHEQAIGRSMTAQEWTDRHSPDVFRQMCRRAAEVVGLGDGREDLVYTIVSAAMEAEEALRNDARPWQFEARPLTHPAEVTFPAYAVAYQESYGLPDHHPSSVIRSGGRVRMAIVRAVRSDGGAASLEEVTGVVSFTYSGLPGVFIATPVPDPGHPRCSGCGQWATEHSPPDSDACTHFQAAATDTTPTPQPA